MSDLLVINLSIGTSNSAHSPSCCTVATLDQNEARDSRPIPDIIGRLHEERRRIAAYRSRMLALSTHVRGHDNLTNVV